MTDNRLAVFENYKIRRHYDEQKEIWYFSVVDIIQVLIQQADYQTARKYWNKLKERLRKEGSESVTNCHRLKLKAADGKNYLTAVADPETLLRLVQSVKTYFDNVKTKRLIMLIFTIIAVEYARREGTAHA